MGHPDLTVLNFIETPIGLKRLRDDSYFCLPVYLSPKELVAYDLCLRQFCDDLICFFLLGIIDKF